MRTYYFLFSFKGASFSVAGIDFNAYSHSVISLPSTANTTELASKT